MAGVVTGDQGWPPIFLLASSVDKGVVASRFNSPPYSLSMNIAGKNYD